MRKGTLPLALVAALLATSMSLAATARAADPPRRVALTKAQKTALEQSVIPAVMVGDPAAVMASLSPFAAKLSEAHEAAADELLAERGLPSVSELLVENRLALVEQNRASGLPAPQGRELPLTVRGLNDAIQELIDLRTTHAAFRDVAANADFAQFEERLWGMHVLSNRLEGGARLARYAKQLVDSAQKRNVKTLTDADREVLATDFAALYAELESMYRELNERGLETRVARVEYADKVLAESKDVKERLQAAFVLDLDGELLAAFFDSLAKAEKAAATAADAANEKPDPKAAKPDENADDPAGELAAGGHTIVMFRSMLADPELPAKIREHVRHGQQSAGQEFIAKSRLLFTGLHWWFRGRYGMGTEGHGLLKSKAALTSPDVMFALYMPQTTPVPTDPSQGGMQIPLVDRRHHYLWQFETRQVLKSYNEGTDTDSETIEKPRVTGVEFRHFY